MSLPLTPPYPPMEAKPVDEIPTGTAWQYEPKWDGFRCIAFVEGEDVYLQSKAGKPLARYFPDLVEALRKIPAKRFVLDGEITIPIGEGLSFEELQLRLHPAESRVRKLAAAHPAMFVAFDLLVDERGRLLTDEPLHERRAKLLKFAADFLDDTGQMALSPATLELKQARKWFASTGNTLDGIVAKDVDAAYASGERTAVQKIKNIRTADCVVGGFRYGTKEKVVGSLLLGLYDDAGRLNHVGFTSSFSDTERKKLTSKLEKLAAKKNATGFTGAAPGAPSRWSTERSTEWTPLPHELIAEVEWDHFSGGRFRHGTRFLRWRPDKSPEQCNYEQIPESAGQARKLLKRPTA